MKKYYPSYKEAVPASQDHLWMKCIRQLIQLKRETGPSINLTPILNSFRENSKTREKLPYRIEDLLQTDIAKPASIMLTQSRYRMLRWS